MQKFDEAAGWGDAGEKCACEMGAKDFLAAEFGVALFAEPKSLQKAVEGQAVEFSTYAFEGRCGPDVGNDRLVRNGEVEVYDVIVQGGAAEQVGQRSLVNAEHARLFLGEAAANLTRDEINFPPVGIFKLAVGDRDVADFGQFALAIAAEDVFNTPDGEADDEQANQGLGNPAECALAECFEHWCSSAPGSANR